MDDREGQDIANNEDNTKDLSEVLEWDEHYATRKKMWRLNEEKREDVTESLE